ncbi:MAG: hypothetical protein QOF19_2676 [Alphaproteobacteria bacterium]|nr:hypothetical protein [Alphaproteobacteria bacterium]
MVDHRLAFTGFILGGTAVVVAILIFVIHGAKPGPSKALKLELPPAAPK